MTVPSVPDPTESPGPDAHPPAPEEPRLQAPEPLRVLLVEDDAVARAFLTEMLEMRGHAVDARPDAEMGLATFRRRRPELVVLDRSLPEMDGIELCRKIRALPDTDDTVILFVTGAEAHEALDEALRAGANDYVVKPVAPDVLHVRLAIAERRIAERRALRQREAELEKRSFRDDVTDLGNRAMLRDQLDKAAGRARRSGDHIFAVLLVDLDGFHGINERYGREAGDQVLGAVGARIRECVREVDTPTRIAADQFAVHLDDLKRDSDPTRVANRIQEAMNQPVRVDEREVYVSACIGIAVSADASLAPEDLIRDAGKALTRAKSRGRGEVQIYDPDVHARAMARFELEDRLRQALEEKALSLHYQPILTLETGEVSSVEALLRWEQEDGSLVLPGNFISVAEETGLIVPLGWWTLETACGQVREWQEAMSGGGSDSTVHVSVNLSARQLAQPDMDEIVARTLERAEVDPRTVHLELTETSVMADVTGVLPKLDRLKELGLHLHIDDFGTGYSSLSHLSRLPFDTLKIDREFIWQMGESSEDFEVVRTIVQLARTLRMGVVAEGVETEEQAGRLRELGCDFVQGYLYHRPMTADRIPDLLQGVTPR